MKAILTLVFALSVQVVAAQSFDSAQFYFQKGIVEKNAGRYFTAAQYFNQSLTFDSTNTETFMENAFVYKQMRKTDQARVMYLKIFQLQPNDKKVAEELMNIYFNYKQYAKALDFAKLCEGCAKVDRIKGISYYELEDYPSAEIYLKKAITSNPSDAEAVYKMARNYVEMEEYNKAIPYYYLAVRFKEAKPMWMYEQGILLYNMSDYSGAVNSFIDAVNHGYARTNDFTENFGYACLYNGDYEQGEKMLMELWLKKPGNKDLLRGLAEVLYQKRQYDRSLTYCQKMLELDANDGKALYQAGLCFQKKGQVDKGQQMCDKAISMDPSLESLRRKKEITSL